MPIDSPEVVSYSTSIDPILVSVTVFELFDIKAILEATPGNEAERTHYRSFYFCGPKFMKFWDNVGDPSYFPAPLPIVYVTFPLEDIRHLVSKSSKNLTNI